MAEGFLRAFDPNLEVYSAGTRPSAEVNPKAIAVMKEVGIDLSLASPKNVDRFVHESFDYVVTVCDKAKETCPVFLGKVRHRFHMGFEDPAEALGTEDEVMTVFRRVRDEIRDAIKRFYSETISSSNK